MLLTLITLSGLLQYRIESTSSLQQIFNSARSKDISNQSNNANNDVDSQAKSFLPDTCHQHMVANFTSLSSQIEQGKNSAMGKDGGEWSACTHIKLYGMNFAAFFARHLAYGLKPKSVLEFGCGLGTTSDFLARFVPGGSNVVCVEPEPMIGEVFGAGSGVAKRFPFRPVQLSMLSFSPEAKTCSDKLYDVDMGFELVLSLEVAEHVPPEFTGELIRRLASATTKYLVFAAARPGQGGTGHIDESMHNRTWWIEQFTSVDRGEQGKLKLLPHLSRTLRRITGFQERAYDFGTNLVAFGAPGVEDVSEIPKIAHSCVFPPIYGTSSEFKSDGEDEKYAKEHDMPISTKVEACPPATEEQKKQRGHWVEGQAMALWPELDLMIRRVKSGELVCG